ncbi:hypothetical protein RH915_10020 [Serpentinicella sp. ANB-PHB4]|nr:hypothetical protein [Serpentinicella sp. ANB-PHB4]
MIGNTDAILLTGELAYSFNDLDYIYYRYGKFYITRNNRCSV